ncbi:MAG: hypothetical protein QHH24_00865 [Candidatus Bathyarchaeota archaeon]|jgi:hypothetical protein|nr:hypothetical protein [Candidatus Bathyarchaeota archaeon]
MKDLKTEKALETGPLERLYNGVAPAKILDFLILFHDYDYSKMDVAKNSGVSFRHALREMAKLEELGLIKQTRTVGHAQMYKLNTENPAAILLRKFALEIAGQEAQKIADREIAKEEADKQAQKTETVTA